MKTHYGLSERSKVENIICKGDPWGPIQCSVQIDGIGRDSLNKDLEPFKYKNKVEIPALGMIDDILTITESGYKTARMNSYITAKIAIKKLQFGPKKCFVLHTGKQQDEYKNTELYVDGWILKHVVNVETGQSSREDIIEGDMEISHPDSEKYLGQILSADGKNTKNIEKMRNKGIGIKNRVIQILEEMPGGKFHFTIAVIYRNSYLISSILSSSEVWYGVTKAEIEQLEQVDEMWIRDLMNCSRSVPKDLLYLELGILPIRYIVQTRRLLYLHHILCQESQSLLYRFFIAQLENPTQRDWVSQVLEDLEYINVDLEIEAIKSLKRDKFKEIIKEAVKLKAFSDLKQRKKGRNLENSKGKQIVYEELIMAEYLISTEEDISIEERKWIFKCRVEDIDIKGNQRWKYTDISCSSCMKKIDETQIHLLNCEVLLGKNENISYIPEYSELYTGNLKEQAYVSRILKENHERRIFED